MFSYFLLILIANIYSSSFGYPSPTITKVLDNLQNTCKNKDVVAQIKNKSDICSKFSQKKWEIKCLLFYDINVKLCNFSSPINEQQLTLLNKAQNVVQFCDSVKQFNFTNLVEFPTYKDTIEKLLNKPATCEKLCEVDDIDSDDTDYFCKYYQWGMDLLAHKEYGTSEEKTPAANGDLTRNKINAVFKPQPQQIDKAISTPEMASKVLGDSRLMDSAVETQPISHQPVSASGLGSQVSETENKANILKLQETQLSSNIINGGDATQKKENSGQAEQEPLPSADGNIPLPQQDSPIKDIPQPFEISEKSVIEVSKPVDQTSKPVSHADQAGKSEADEYDEDKYGMGGVQGVDDPDSDVNSKTNPESVKKTDIPISPFGELQKEYIANPIPDGFASDEDDHFFPFFLTTVVMVVLLYVLYHNKNKVGKVFFGLLVEGRSARRRNSRGHSYRRLDTLEQAISTDAAAAPSKIIY